jgi:hypothetical protein
MSSAAPRKLEYKGRTCLVEEKTCAINHSGEACKLFWFDALSDLQIESPCPLAQVTLRMGPLTILSRAELLRVENTGTKWIYGFCRDFRGYSIEMPRVLNTAYFECRGFLQCVYEPADVSIVLTCKTVVVPMDLYKTYLDYYLVDVQFLKNDMDPATYRLWE